MGRVKEALFEEVVGPGPDDQYHELHDIDIDAIRHLVEALAALKEANSVTMHGSVSDHCGNAAVDIRKALRCAGT